MDPGPQQQPDYQALIRSWESRTWWYRRLSARIGLQGKLVISFCLLLAGALCGSCWLLLNQNRAILDRVAAEHAEQMGRALAHVSQTSLAQNDSEELARISRDLLKHHEIVAVAFFSPRGAVLSSSCRDPRLATAFPELWRDPTQTPWQLGQPMFGYRPEVGRFVQIAIPVLNASSPTPTHPRSVKIVGHVMVCLSQAESEAAITQMEMSLVSFNLVVALLTVPVVLVLVHRIFGPIRELVTATNRIAAGDLDTEVAIHRPDTIGMIARSFNDMIRRVREQQQQLTDANQELAQANKTLEERIRTRTAELVTANQRLSGEISEKEEFLRAVSHDLGAPLRNIAGMAAMLLMNKRDVFDDEVVQRLQRIQKNVEMETSLIAELMELSQIKTRRERMEIVPIEEVIGELVEVFDEDLRTRGIRLDLDTSLPRLRCERNRIRQLFQNLIDNAIKYMGNGTQVSEGQPAVKEIHIGSRQRNVEIEFYVRDTGMGIDPRDVGRVFQVFRRGREAAAMNIPGRGVGLSSVKSIIETYNGQISVESEVGKGSLFRFTIHSKYLADRSAGPGALPAHQDQSEEELAAAG